MKRIRILTKLEFCNLFGYNVFKNTKDKKARRKSIAMAVVIGVLLVMLMSYIVGLSYGLVILGAASIVPAYLIMIASLIIIAINIFKTGGTIFRKKGHDIISSLPISDKEVVLSRLLKVYVENLMITGLLVLPGMIVYAIFVCPQESFYIVGILSLFVIPLIPVTIATAIGALITGISSRMKHKALVESGISILFVMTLIIGSFSVSENTNEFTMDMMKNLETTVTALLGKVYPLAIVLGEAIVQGDFLKFLMMVLISLAIFAFSIVVISARFGGICRRLYATSATHSYKMETLQKSSVLKALIAREAKHYFSSGTYVTNTIIGPVMGVAFSIALLFFDLEELAVFFPVALNLNAAIPYMMAAIFTIMNVTSTSISMEGKEFWIVKSLPLNAKTVLDSKLIFNLCLFSPFYLVSVLMMIIALQPDKFEIIWIILMPALIILCSCVFGITANLLFPKLDWENEVTVIKQSASSAIGGMSGFLISLLCMFTVLFVPSRFTNGVNALICILLAAATIFLYRKNNKADFKTLRYS